MSNKKIFKRLNLLVLRVFHKKYKLSLVLSVLFSFVAMCTALAQAQFLQSSYGGQVLGVNNIEPIAFEDKNIQVEAVVHSTPTPSLTPSPTKKPTPTPTEKPLPTTITKNSQYTAEKIGDTTWKVKNVQNDNNMASPSEIVNALNSYRGEHGKPNLTIDNTLQSFAQERANLFSSRGSLDSHSGFRDYMNNGGFEKSGFNALGENSAMLSGPMNGDKIIRQIFGADPEHDGNQLNDWTHVGVGVNGNAVNVNFGKNKR